MHITLEIDEEAKALYFRLREGDIAETIEYPGQQEIFLDLDEGGQLLAIEMLDPSSINVESIFKELTECYGIGDLSPLIHKSLIEFAA